MSFLSMNADVAYYLSSRLTFQRHVLIDTARGGDDKKNSNIQLSFAVEPGLP